MSKKERLEVSPYFEKSYQIANKIDDSNFNNNEGVKKVNAFYIYIALSNMAVFTSLKIY